MKTFTPAEIRDLIGGIQRLCRFRTAGRGSFSSGIQAEGLIPCVIAPLPDMQAILRRWRWRCKYVGDTFEVREERWEPRKGKKRD